MGKYLTQSIRYQYYATLLGALFKSYSVLLSSLDSDDSELIDALLALIERHPRWGFPKCHKRLKALGYRWNHNRIYRVYLELRLNMRRKAKR